MTAPIPTRLDPASPTPNDEPLYPPTIEAPDGPLSLIEFLKVFPKNPLRAIPVQAYQDDIFVYGFGGLSYIWVTGPALVEEVLVRHATKTEKTPQEKRVFEGALGSSVLTADHDDWRWQRRALAPLFRQIDLLKYVPAMTQAAEEMVAHWRKAGSCGGVRAVDDDMTHITFDIILATMLKGSQGREAETITGSVDRYLSKAPWALTYALLHLPKWLPHPGSLRMHKASKALQGAVGAIVDRRVAQEAAGETDINNLDLLDRLIAARDPESGKPMNRQQIINNLTTMLVAGHETTAKALTWTLYLLARAPVWQQRIREEVAAVVGDRPIAADDIDKLAVTTRVIKESMRLYPPAPVIVRVVKEPFQLGAHRFSIGTQLVMPLYCIHRHKRIWNDPDRFDPDRFLPEQEAAMPRTQYMPFGAGPRICIGRSFAMIEAVAVLATLVRNASFDWDGAYEPEPISRITLRPDRGMPLTVQTLT